MMSLTNEEKKIDREQKFVLHAKMDLLLMMTVKSIIKPEIIVITPENIKKLLMIFVI